ncbi:lactonase family protein [Motilimonas cestriensis]|uniref:Lactonase family protein n=1 Tax=Motilimonas cestriensis TaxID=2742685 RepID=A0ABS8W4D2_9GAMM|nr:lactonase family protein [Motilimonas cestriensis]MCE2593819.1 lactonase family protein [Motilimonas cestriensis]
MLLYVGGYNPTGTPSIQGLTLIQSAGNIEFNPIVTDNQLDNASYLLYVASIKQLFAVSEINNANEESSGWVAQYDLTQPQQPKLVTQQLSQGGDPCHLTWVNQHLICSNYSGGNFTDFHVTQPALLTTAQACIQHSGSSVISDRQSQAHVHSATTSPDNAFFVVADLGADKLVSYGFNPAGAVEQVFSLNMPAGSGPRHCAFHPNGRSLYVANELNNTITQVQFNPATGELALLDTLPALAANNTNHSYPGEVVVDQQGKFVYLSNRGDDSISCFAIAPDNQTLSFSSSCPTGGKFPRHFALSPNQDVLVVANQQSDNIRLLTRDPHNGTLTLTEAQFAVNAPSCVCFIPN